MFHIGPYRIDSQVVLAPMAGVTDLLFRQLCRRLGAGLVVSEMVTADTRLWNSRKSRTRLNHEGECEPRSVQLNYTGASAVMIGRAAQGRPWLFREIAHFLRHGQVLPGPSLDEIQTILNAHLCELHRFYGDFLGVRIARKHLGWYMKTLANTEPYRKRFNQLDNAEEQHASVQAYFEQLKTKEDQAA